MPETKCIMRTTKGLTLVEMVIAMAIMAIVFAAIVPQFRAIFNSWDSKAGAAETLQNGRVLIDHLNRNLSKAVRITAVSESTETDGFIGFQDNDSNTLRYDVDANYYVEFGPVGDLSELAGPVSQFQFTCYDACDLDTALDISTADVNDIRFVKVETTLTDSSALGQDKTFIAWVYLRINDESSDCNLAGWWKLDETSGLTAADSSGNGNDGTLTNMVGDEWTTGQIGGALEFDGYNDYVTLPIGSVISSLTDCTIATWVNWDGGGSWQRIWDFGTGTTTNMFLTASNGSTGTPRFAITTSGWSGEEQTTAPDALSTGWHHVAVTIDAANDIHILYLDGSPVAQNTSGSLDPNDLGNTTQNWLGRSQYGADPYFDGSLDDVRIYNRVLETDEIAQLASNISYETFTEAKVDSDATSITIPTPGSGSAVAILGSWTSGLSHTAESGSNRALIFIAHEESTSGSPTLTSVTYGGQTMTKIIEESAVAGYGNYVAAFILDEAGINAATSSTFSPTWSGATSSVSYASVFLSNVDQTTSIGATDSDGTTSSYPNPITTSALSTEDGDMVILGATCGNNGSYTLNNGFTEGIDQSVGSFGHTGVTGHKSATGSNETPSATHSGPNRQVIIGFVVQVGEGGVEGIEGDLLIAAVATDGSETILPPTGEGWTEIDVDNYNGEVTLGAWWKLADASESASHEFTWTGDEQAYGWMMQFTGHDPTDPINDWATDGETSSAPTSPAVTTTVSNCLILRLGAFDGDDITEDDTGLTDHTTITMDKSSSSSSGGTVEILGSWVTGTSHAKESGTNRAFVVIAHAESNWYQTPSLSTVTYGGQTMTKITDIFQSGFYATKAYVGAFILNEAGVDAASSGTISASWSGTSSTSLTSVFLENVDQVTLFGDYDTGGVTNAATVTTSALSTSNGNIVIAGATCTETGTYTPNNGFNEGTESPISNADGCGDYKSATGAAETPSVTHSTSYNRQAIIGFVVQGVELEDTDTVSGGAGYLKQSASGDSGTSDFSLTASEQAQMLTIAIAPNSDSSDCDGGILP